MKESAEHAQQRLVEDFATFEDDPFALYEYLLAYAAGLPVMADDVKEKASLVEGCQSQVWLLANKRDGGTMAFEFDSDTLIVRGILRAIRDIYSGRTSEEIASCEFTFLEQTGLVDLFSADRQGGIKAVMNAVRTADG